MKRIALLLAISLIAFTAHAQPQAPTLVWRQYLSDEWDYQDASVCRAADGAFVVTGYRNQFTQNGVLSDAYLWKIDSLGETEWFKTIGSADKWEEPAAMCLTPDNGYVLAGSRPDETHQSDDQADVIVIAADASGDSLWLHCYNLGYGDEIHSVAPASDGGYILAGSSDLGEDQVTNMSLFKISAEGDSLWTSFFTSGMMAQGASAKPTPDGGYILVGTSRVGSAYVGHAFVIKTDAQGQVEWQRVYGSATQQLLIKDVVVTPDSGYAVTGSAFISQARNGDAFILRLSATGDSLWMNYYGRSGRCADIPGMIMLMPDSGFVIGGSAEPLDGNNNTICQMHELIAVNSSGVQQWLASVDSSQTGTSQSFCLTRDMGFVTAGVDWNVADGRLHVNRLRALPNAATPVHPQTPRGIALYPNYPNPFNPTTEIRFDLPQAMRVELKIYNSLGQQVTTLADGLHSAGSYTVTWNGRSADGVPVASGTYIYQLKAGAMTESRQMIFMR